MKMNLKMKMKRDVVRETIRQHKVLNHSSKENRKKSENEDKHEGYNDQAETKI